jgi:2-keto-3-deoxy-L-rhamnonate aldolase RhmA
VASESRDVKRGEQCGYRGGRSVRCVCGRLGVVTTPRQVARRMYAAELPGILPATLEKQRTDVTSQTNLRARIAAGDELVALRGDIGWSKDQIAAGLGGGQYDFIWLDSQHSPYSDQELVSFTAAAEQLGIPVQLRIPHTRDAHKVGHFFDFGINGALVPEVMEAATVQDALDFAYYGPIGRRSWGGGNRLGLRTRTAPTARREYAAWWNETVLLSIQIESVQTVTNIARLVQPGITHVTFGPNDLEFSLDLHPEYPLRTVEACMQNVAEQLKGSKIRIAMGTVTTPAERPKYRELGVKIFLGAS